MVSAIKPPTSLFPQMLGTAPAARGLVRAPIPEDLRRLVVPKLEGAFSLAPNEIPVWGALVAKVGEKLLPTLREGEIDLAGALCGPFKDDRYGIVAGLRVKDAAAVEQALRDAVKDLPKEGQEVIKLDALTENGIKVHKIVLPPLPKTAEAIFGASTVYLAFRPNAILAAFGENALEGLRSGFAAKPQPCDHYMVEAFGRKLVPLVTKIDAEGGKQFKAFLGDDIDRIPIAELVIEGGAALKVRYGNVLAQLMPVVLFLGRNASAQFQPVAPALPPPKPRR
jgi:hypothetical protein